VCYSLWYNACMILPAGSLQAEGICYIGFLTACEQEHLPLLTSCNTNSSVPEDGQNDCPKHVELI
jgi:hypothetical protein